MKNYFFKFLVLVFALTLSTSLVSCDETTGADPENNDGTDGGSGGGGTASGDLPSSYKMEFLNESSKVDKNEIYVYNSDCSNTFSYSITGQQSLSGSVSGGSSVHKELLQDGTYTIEIAYSSGSDQSSNCNGTYKLSNFSLSKGDKAFIHIGR